MTAQQAIVAVVLVAAALWLWPEGGVVPRRRRTRRRWDPAVRRMLVIGAGTVAAGVLLSVPWWAVLVLTVTAVAGARFAPTRRRPLDVAGMRDLAGTLDLVATCLDAGLPVGRSITAVLRALEASAGEATGASSQHASQHGGSPDPRVALAEVAALLALGTDAEGAWRPAAAIPELAELATAARRSAVGGVRLADAVRESAAELRSRCRAAGERSAARAGVAMTAPLAVCFLPAFVCLGLAPVVIGMVSTLHIW